MTAITENYIVNKICAEWDEAMNICNEKGIYPAHTLSEISIEKSICLGKANTGGRITISSNLIGTNEYLLLIEVIKHEIAHLIAGVSAGHGKKWEAISKLIGCKPERCASASKEILEKSFRYKLIAVLPDGKEILTGYRNEIEKEVFKKGKTYTVNGSIVSYFYYKKLA